MEAHTDNDFGTAVQPRDGEGNTDPVRKETFVIHRVDQPDVERATPVAHPNTTSHSVNPDHGSNTGNAPTAAPSATPSANRGCYCPIMELWMCGASFFTAFGVLGRLPNDGVSLTIFLLVMLGAATAICKALIALIVSCAWLHTGRRHHSTGSAPTSETSATPSDSRGNCYFPWKEILIGGASGGIAYGLLGRFPKDGVAALATFLLLMLGAATAIYVIIGALSRHCVGSSQGQETDPPEPTRT